MTQPFGTTMNVASVLLDQGLLRGILMETMMDIMAALNLHVVILELDITHLLLVTIATMKISRKTPIKHGIISMMKIPIMEALQIRVYVQQQA